ncbi:MAG: hypothetical protein ACI9BD_000472 [Candidatus Marinamargulisbacteria bacterium]|jgi:hypothetical protein
MAKKKLNKIQTKALLPVMRQFNKLAAGFIKLLTERVEQKEKQLANIKVMVTGVTIPVKDQRISITTVDINKTIVKKKGQMSFTQKMDWEDELRKKKRGLIL